MGHASRTRIADSWSGIWQADHGGKLRDQRAAAQLSACQRGVAPASRVSVGHERSRRRLTTGPQAQEPVIHHEALRELQLSRWKLLRRVDIDRELRGLYGDQATFWGKQRQAVASIMYNKSPVFVVMGTGMGKSLCFMLPAASCPGGADFGGGLLGDMMVRCEKMGIACAEWRTDRTPGNVSIVFVTPESALTKRFVDYVEALRVTSRLDRFVIDECHTVLASLLASDRSVFIAPSIREVTAQCICKKVCALKVRSDRQT